MTIMVWALTIPVIILIGLFQYGVITGTSLISTSEEPYFLLTFLLYIPIAIVIFLLVEQKGIVQEQSAHISRANPRNGEISWAKRKRNDYRRRVSEAQDRVNGKIVKNGWIATLDAQY